MRLRRLALVAALLSTTGCGYNRIQELDESAAQARSQIETMLKRRADLVPQLVATVRGVANQELEVLTRVTEARAGLVRALETGDAEQLARANQELSAQLAIVNRSVVEAYPQLQSNESFLRLQDELVGTENRITVARTDYNQAVRQYNAYIRRFPQNLTARVIGAEPREYFEVTDPADLEVPEINFERAGS